MAHYLITGHTGFKGAWLIFLLKAQGHDVSGLALDPLHGSIFERTNLESDLVHDFRVDIRNRDETVEAIRRAQPDYVLHMAAQALVREGYRNPRYTYETNVLGTLNVLEAVDQTGSVRAQLIVTTDKVYLDQGLNRPYVETDPLGGKDPYSASKAMADILAQEFLSRAGAKPGAVVRAGNVIGAGDASADRLIPDLLRSFQGGAPAILRYPAAVRPWQHVLDCLLGYLLALNYVTSRKEFLCLNFGPDTADFATVGSVVEEVESLLGRKLTSSDREHEPDMGEAIALSLDSSLSRKLFAWSENMPLRDAIADAVALIGTEPPRTVREHIESKISEAGAGRV